MLLPTPLLRCLAIILLLTGLPPAFAQQASSEPTRLRQQMSAEDFKAAGLDKLSATELSRLEAWLNREVSAQAAVVVEQAVAQARESAREEGRQEVVDKNRGFFHFGSEDPIESTISGEFNGFGKGRKYRLDNGQVWEQVDSARLDGVRKSNPGVRIRPGVLGAWWLKIDGYNTQAKVLRIE